MLMQTAELGGLAPVVEAFARRCDLRVDWHALLAAARMGRALAVKATRRESFDEEIVGVCPFSWRSPASMIVGAVRAKAQMRRVLIVVSEAFDDRAARLVFGVRGGAELFAREEESALWQSGEYEFDEAVHIAAAAHLAVTVRAGVATRGAGLLLYRVIQ